MNNFIKMKKYNYSGKKMYIDEENIYTSGFKEAKTGELKNGVWDSK
jgi:hypothetical protein